MYIIYINDKFCRISKYSKYNNIDDSLFCKMYNAKKKCSTTVYKMH